VPTVTILITLDKLVNTGWTSGPYGVGARMKQKYTPAMIDAALNGV